MYYMYSQNNSGGTFNVDDFVSHYVIIEADNSSDADDRAERIGIYFNGVEDEMDCECCGDRWSPAWDSDAREVPSIYDTPVSDYQDSWTMPGQVYAYVYHKDGRKDTFRSGPSRK